MLPSSKPFCASSSSSILPRVFRVLLSCAMRLPTGCAFTTLAALLLGVPMNAAKAQAVVGAQFSLLHSFGSGADGQEPAAGVAFDANGVLYGATMNGGASGDGTLYKVDTSGIYTILHSFAWTDGANPQSEPTVLPNGSLCGTTSSGGSGAGEVFAMNSLAVVSTMHDFADYNTEGSYANSDGQEPLGGMTLGSDGNLYGTSSFGGAGSGGTIYRVELPAGFITLHSFDITDGAQPDSTMVLANGFLYGVTRTGGANDTGTIFKITQSGYFTTLYSFSADSGGNADGANPGGKLLVDSAGTIYGTASNGGAADCGTLFSLSQQGVFTTLHSFGLTASDGSIATVDGAHPISGVILGPDNNLYGATQSGGANDTGTIFRASHTGAFGTIFSFDPDNGGNNTGASPVGGLSFGPDGALYGATAFGGASDMGALYSLDISALPASVAARFDFNRDGHPDLLWYNTSSGAVSEWLMDDDSVLQFGTAFATVDPSTGWQPVASPDINGDGYPDLIWWNSSTGELRAWTLQGDTVLSQGADFAQVSDTDWKPVAAADSGIGATWTLVFQNMATGDIARWLMNGSTVTQYGGALASLGASSPWQVVGAPDIDGDGKSDLLFWNDQTGEVSWWGCDLQNSKVNSFNGDIATVADTSWHLVGSEDCNEDGHADLIWWNANSGIVSRWLMNGPIAIQYGGESTQITDTTWQPTALR